jgi:DNA repair protein RecN (Recombination protein N)
VITRLSIKDLAIINSLQIEFEGGFNVITGETGAGKSILIKALNLLLGGKASPDTVRKGAEQALIVGEFQIPKAHEAVRFLKDYGILYEVEDSKIALIVRRQLNAKGKSFGWINDVAVTGQALKDIGGALVDIFGQHENQKLLNPHRHSNYIDQFLKDKTQPLKVSELYQKANAELKQIEQTLSLFREGMKNQDYLAFRFDELKKLGPTEEDYQQIKTLCESSDKLVALRDVFARALTPLEGSEDGSVSQSIKESAKILGHLPEAQPLKERLLALLPEIEDISFELSKKMESFDVDENELEEAQARLYAYQDLFRKMGAKEIHELLAEKERLERELKAMETVEETLEDSLKNLMATATQLKKEAELLDVMRKKTFSVIKKSVETELADLAMPGARFHAEWKASTHSVPAITLEAFPKLSTHWEKSRGILEGISEKGIEIPEFLLASNPGEATLPLVRIASGGELSRIMLALKKALAADAETCVLVFDEIDAGISGRVADVVGKKMRELSENFQVVCISHLPQVAVYSDAHFLVEKGGKNQRTETRIVRLSEEESAEEIARLLSGAKVTAASINNAKNLIATVHGKGRKKTSSIPISKPR